MNNKISNSFIKKKNILNDHTDNFLKIHNIFRDKDDKLYYYTINQNKLKFNWKNICNENLDFLKFANGLRKFYVDSLKDLIVELLNFSCNNKLNNIINKYCKINALGSNSLVSNYDVNVSSFLYSSNIVDQFNTFFYEFWNDTSGEIFETNFYGNSFFITIPQDLKYNKLDLLYNSLKKNNKIILYLPPKLIDEDTKNNIFNNQKDWLVIKIFLFLDEINKNKINSELLNFLKEFKNMLLEDLITHKKNKLIINEKNKLIEKKYKELESEKKKLYNNNNNDNLYRKKINELYVKKLRKIDEYQKEYQNNNDNKKESLIKLVNSISTSNFYGIETYFCIGTIYHVLGYIQKLCDFQMYPEYYINSMIENLIDIFRYIEYTNKDNNMFLSKSSKYLIRIYDAILRYREMSKLSSNNNSNLIEKKSLFTEIRNSYKNNSKLLQPNSIKKIRQLYLKNNIKNNILNKDNILQILNEVKTDIKNCIYTIEHLK